MHTTTQRRSRAFDGTPPWTAPSAGRLPVSPWAPPAGLDGPLSEEEIRAARPATFRNGLVAVVVLLLVSGVAAIAGTGPSVRPASTSPGQAVLARCEGARNVGPALRAGTVSDGSPVYLVPYQDAGGAWWGARVLVSRDGTRYGVGDCTSVQLPRRG
jgi:hypothetical protein